jgi:transposase
MSIQPRNDHEIPESTRTIAKKVLPEGNMYMRLRDELGELFSDTQFTDLFSNQGQPAEAPGRLALVTLMQFAEGLSDRQTADAVRLRIDWKYALGLELDDPGFDYSVLSEFRSRLVEGSQTSTLLDTLLARFKERGWLKARGKQRTDSTHIVAAIRSVNRLILVGETLRRALNEIALVAPEWLRSLAPSNWWGEYGRRFDNLRHPKDKVKRDEYAERIGQDGLALLNAVRQSSWSDELQALPGVEILRQVWIQQFWTEYLPDESRRLRLRDHENQPSGYHLISSPYDVESRFSVKHDGSTTWIGYKTHFTETCDEGEDTVHLITHVETTEAVKPDNLIPDSIHAALAKKELLPQEHLMDAGCIDADLLVDAPRDYGVTICGPLAPSSSWQAQAAQGYALTDFKIDWTARQATCPQGHTSKSWQKKKYAYTRELTIVQFDPATCRACPARSQCTRAQKAPRVLHLRDQAIQESLQNQRQHQETPEFRKQYALRSGIEGTLSQAIRVCKMRRSRYIGLAKTHLQMVATAAAINLYRLYDWLVGNLREATRVSVFAALAPATVSVPKGWRF